MASIVLGYYKFNLNNIGKEEKIFLDEAKRILTHYNVTELDKDTDWDNILKA